MTTTNAAVIAVETEQTKTIAKFLSTMAADRPTVTFEQSERDGKIILQGHGDKQWPEIAIGKKGGVVIQVRTYDESKKSAFEWALEADGLLERQMGRDAKRAGVGKEEVVVEKNIPAAPEKKPRTRKTKDEVKADETAAKHPDLMELLKDSIKDAEAAKAKTAGK